MYDLRLDHIEYDRNVLVERVVDIFLEKFVEKWSGKSVNVKGVQLH